VDFRKEVVGERCVLGRSTTAKTYGRSTSETVGLSSENMCENHMHRKTKGSHGRFVRVGLAGD
jgi:hypothetical protein